MRVLIVDDHEVVRRGVRSLLSAVEGVEVCGEAVDGMDAIAKANELKPDVITMDISMPNLNGLEATREIRRLLPDTEILILSQHDVPEMMKQALSAGASGYVVKSAISTELVEALERIRRGEKSFDGAVFGSAKSNIDTQEILQRSIAFEKALRESEERFRAVFETTPECVKLVGRDGTLLQMNASGLAMVGADRAESVVGTNVYGLIAPEDRNKFREFNERICGGVKGTLQFAIVGLKGERRQLETHAAPLRNPNGTVVQLAVTRDITERLKAEEAQARLAAIVESSDDAIISKDLNGIIRSWNAGAQRIFGYSAQEAVGKPITLVIPRELHDEEKQIIRRLRAGERIDHYETVRVSRSGERLNISLTISPMKNAEGTIIGASKIARDVTERKRAELAIERGEQQFRVLADTIPELCWMANPDGYIFWYNQRWYEYTGTRPEQMEGWGWQSVHDPAVLPEVLERWRATIDSGKPFEMVFPLRGADGKFRPFLTRTRPLKDENGKVVRWFGVNTDIAAQRAREEALREREGMLRGAFSQTYSFLALLNLDGTILEANRAAAEAAGCEREELVGRPFWEAWRVPLPEEVATLKSSIVKARNGETVREECYFCLPDGTRRFADRTINPVKDNDGNVVMIVATGVDVTEQKELRDKLEARVQERTQELERKNKELREQTEVVRELSGQLLQSQDQERRRIARELHDSVGQLLSAVKMNISTVLAEKKKLSATAAKCVEENSAMIEQVTAEIRTLSHLLHPPLLEELGLESILGWYIEGFSERSKIQVSLELPSDIGRLSHDHELSLFRIVQESLTNIHRHSGSTTARVRLSRTADKVKLEVMDEGKGIGPEVLAKISSGGSAGVGLRGMRERVRQIGGAMEMRSEGKGTAVVVVLPLAKEDMAPGSDDHSAKQAARRESAQVHSKST